MAPIIGTYSFDITVRDGAPPQDSDEAAAKEAPRAPTVTALNTTIVEAIEAKYPGLEVTVSGVHTDK